MKIEILGANTQVKRQKLRVCAYARVSTASDAQEDSLDNQRTTYERLISSNPEYEFVGVYADQGISGYSEHRPAFQNMLQDAREHRIDLILTKSISRFARNTVTVLKYVRELKELGVGILFEEQNIHTLSHEGELMLSVLASFAQEESRSTSENNRWTVRKRFEHGEPIINTTCFMGYDKNEYGELVVNPEQAAIVRRIFHMYLSGYGAFRIAQIFNQEGVPTVRGGKWADRTILDMLRNEKYKGDYLLQKYYTPENMRNRSVRNNGEVQSYYIAEDHEPIVTVEEWDEVQRILETRKAKRGMSGSEKYSNRYPLSGMLFCPYCGKTLRRKQVHNKRIEWWCSTYILHGKAACKGIHVRDEEIPQITEKTVVEEVIRDGEKHYCYTSKADFDAGIHREPVIREDPGSRILPCVNRPRRTAIKL